MQQRLTNASLERLPANVRRPAYKPGAIGVGIVHLGAGAFFKAHQAVYTDSALELGGGDWGICAVSLNSIAAKAALAPQDCLYTLKLLDDPAQFRVIGSIRQVLAGPDDRAVVIARLADPRIRIVTLTITEKGYCLGADGRLDFDHPGIKADLTGAGAPNTGPGTALGILSAGLAARVAKAGPPLAIISCDNLSENGTRLSDAVMAFTQCLDPKLADWIDRNVAFPSTMVDSITPASNTALGKSVAVALGVEDKAPVHREAFADWVIEDFDGPRPAWDLAGAVFTPDVTPYESAKLRLVNAPHSALAYLGLLGGHQNVAQVMADKNLAGYFDIVTEQELIPSLGASPLIDLGRYRDRIAQRFANPAIHHQLAQIAADGSAKLQQRLLAPLFINHNAGRSIAGICLGIAAWMLYVMRSIRRGAVVNDPLQDVLARVASDQSGGDESDVTRLLALADIFPVWMGADTKIVDTITDAYHRLSTMGVHNVLNEGVHSPP